MKRTKIICTMGPNTNDKNILMELARNGMNVARFNFSHGDYNEHMLSLIHICIGNNLLLVMGMGVLVSLAPLVVGYLFAKYIGTQVKSGDEADSGEIGKTYEQLVAEFGQLPSGFIALAPILVPIVLMALGSIASMAHWTGFLYDICSFLGTPIIALAVGTIFGVIQMSGAGKMGDFYKVTNETLKTVGPILFVTAAGGVLGKVISSTSMVRCV